ncbi:MAG TPA: VCBS repeat-containing protein [Cyclobacteriaceae bacterium]|nr:VCBS repeat-containing protein [Cyclobacteriaceae bacterium]
MFESLDGDRTGVHFENTIKETGDFNILTTEYIYNGGGVGVADFDNNGLSDLFFAGNMVPNRMYLNQGDFKFNDVTETALINVQGRWNSGVSIVDINNDGWMDVYVTATMLADSANRRNMLFVNNGLNPEGIPTFSEMAGSYGIDDKGYSQMAAFFDYDNDDDLDLYVLTNARMTNVPTNYRPKIVDGTALNNDRFYRNNGDGTFTNATKEAGITIEGYGLGLAIADFNLDGRPDIYVSNDYLSNDILYINNGNGTFTNQIGRYIGHQSQFSMGSDVADVNNDGRPDIVTTDMLAETNARKKTTVSGKSYQNYINNEQFGYEYQYMRNMLHLNNGMEYGMKFSEIGQLAGVYQTEWSWAPLFIDMDNDGYKDILITNGFPKDITDKDFANYRADVGNIATPEYLIDSIPVIKIPNYAFRNNGSLVFTDVSAEWGLDQPSFSNGAVFADFDKDGDLDYVTNNINQPAFVFRNNLEKITTTPKHWIGVQLEGTPGNKMAIGSKVTIHSGGGIQFGEESLYRGFLSSVDPQMHFGLGQNTTVDSVVVQWPDNSRSVTVKPAIDQSLKISYSGSRTGGATRPELPAKWFQEKSADLGIDFVHPEEDFIDYNRQRTLPHKFSQAGPGIAVGDINGDNMDDFVVGGSVGHDATIFFGNKNGKFARKQLISATLKAPKTEEDEGLLLFDADNDGDQDLYIVGGGYEADSASYYRDRLYVNDGKGNYKQQPSSLPDTNAAGSCVRAADIDNDGDLDLFVGGRTMPHAYPMPAASYILINDNGKFLDKTADWSADVQRVGMVTDALWSDINNDDNFDLIVVGEFMPVTIFVNDGQKLTKLKDTGIDDQSGWWNSLTAADFDSDGDIDYVAGNLGLNNAFQVTPEYPVVCVAKDFDANGSIDPVIACYMRESMQGTKRNLYPVHFWDELNSQSPKFRRKFSRYRQFSKITMAELLTAEESKDAVTLTANQMATSYIENIGNGKFKMSPLPIEAQTAPVNGMVTDDFNNDGNIDIMMIGNDYGNEVFAGRYDAFIGLLLAGNGNGSFRVVSALESGFVVDGDAKALARLSTPGGNVYLATQNRGPLRAFTTSGGNGTLYRPSADDRWAEIQLSNGRKQRLEFYKGSGYLSQSGSAVFFPDNAAVTVHTLKNGTKPLN